MLTRLYSWITSLAREEGQDMIEYALIAAVVSVAVVLAVAGIMTGAFGDWANAIGDTILTNLPA